MTAYLVIKGGRIIDPASGIDGTGDLLIADGRVAEVNMSGGLAGPEGTAVINASGMIVSPGFVDLHAHLREPGFEEKETIATGTLAAAYGGFTTICCMPNTNPAIDSQATVDFILAKAKAEGSARVLPVGAVSKGRAGRELAELGELAAAGCVGFSDDGSPVADAHLMRSALTYAKPLGLPIMDHCEDPALSGGVMHEGWVSTRLGLQGVPSAAEETMVARNIQLAELTGGHVHISHMSTAGSVEMVRQAKARGVRVTCEVTPHHLTLTDAWAAGGQSAIVQAGILGDGMRPMNAAYDTNTKVNPPLRSKENVAAMVQALADGVIDAIATDHAPHTVVDKLCEYDAAAFGISGFETALGSLMSLVHTRRIDIPTLIAHLTWGPAQIIDRQRTGLGTLRTDAPADVVIFDPNEEWVVDVDDFVSKGKNSPLHGQTLKGRIVTTVYGGRIVFDGKAVAAE